ncbi:MAG: thioredoxin domain-containing protein [Clostridiales bacterium]|nr:thioredoxin domain-containing protein [Clostridiales bacterium]
MEVKQTNRLAGESSPYLLQHKYNPIDWYPWCDEVFKRARTEQKVIFLSIGYSSCHWCHVMAHEVFENEEAAALLNEHFICVKVDREERPDVDHLYMEACVALTGSGGWPLSLFLTPEGYPFFAGSYFPLSAFLSLAGKVARLWQERRTDVQKASDQVLGVLSQSIKGASWQETLPQRAFEALRSIFDRENGGFGPAPKFPSVQMLLFLMRFSMCAHNDEAMQMVDRTLEQMALGGLFDHVGGGFFRYSTDEKFLIPHFEKMLYDNAMLLLVYAQAGRLKTAAQVYDFCVRSLMSPEGAFYTALDADSEGSEGGYYLFSYEEAKQILGDEAEPFCRWYDITSAGNFEGKNHVNLLKHGPLKEKEEQTALSAIEKLFAAQAKRALPARDDKILLSSNGLMLAALSVYGAVTGSETVLAQAQKLADFLYVHMRKGGRYYASFCKGLSTHPATSEDYVYLAFGLLHLHQVTLEQRPLAACLSVCQELLALFADQDGLLFMAGRDVKDIPIRTKDTYDGALPSGNSLAAEVFYRLYLLTGEETYRQAFDQIKKALGGQAQAHPTAYTALMSAVLFSQKGLRVELSKNCFHALHGYYPFVCFVESESNETHGIRICRADCCLASVSGPAELERILQAYGKTGQLKEESIE